MIIVTIAGANFLNTMGSGMLTVALPTIAKSVGLSVELLLWYYYSVSVKKRPIC